MKKILFFDLDGTLLTTKKDVLDENKEAIRKAQEAGIEVVICSGRQLNAVKRYRDLAGAGKYIICANGAEIINTETNNVLFSCPIDRDVCERLVDLVRDKSIYVRIDTKYARYISDAGLGLTEEVGFNISEIDQIVEENEILQMSFGVKEEIDADKLMENIAKIIDIKVENKFYADYLPEDKRLWIINIINTSVSKGNAIVGLCKYLRIDVDKEAVAFGDDKNDISMMELVKNSIAMGNGDKVVKEKASKVIGHNDEPSIAEEIYKIIEDNKKDVNDE